MDKISKLEKKIQKQYQKILISSFSHDIRTPINGIEGIIENLLNFNFPVKALKKLDIISSLSKKLLYYIDILQDFTKIETNTFKPSVTFFSLMTPISEVFNIFKKEFTKKGLVINLINTTCNCKIYNDFKRIKEICFVLIGNALKYTLKGNFSIKIVHDHISSSFEATFIDSGIGISLERQSHIFELFSQKEGDMTSINPQGIGLGLYVSKQIITKLEGDLQVKSQEGDGSQFILNLKSINHPEDEVKEQNRFDISKEVKEYQIPNSTSRFIENSPTFPISCNCPKYLVVDDDLINLSVLRNYLKGINEYCDEALNGQEAIDKVIERGNIECCKRYKIIFMDINMPVMDGVKATEFLKNQMELNIISYTPIIAVSAAQTGEDDIESKLILKGFDAFSQKPISRDTFISLIKRYSNSHEN